jgi:hypothetical protein
MLLARFYSKKTLRAGIFPAIKVSRATTYPVGHFWRGGFGECGARRGTRGFPIEVLLQEIHRPDWLSPHHPALLGDADCSSVCSAAGCGNCLWKSQSGPRRDPDKRRVRERLSLQEPLLLFSARGLREVLFVAAGSAVDVDLALRFVWNNKLAKPA